MNTLWRIYTEDVNRETVERLASEYFEGYTIYQARGVWKGTAENSLIIEIMGDVDPKAVRELAQGIKHANSQEAVLVVQSAIQGELV